MVYDRDTNAVDTPLVEDDTGCLLVRRTQQLTIGVISVSCRGPTVEKNHEQPCER